MKSSVISGNNYVYLVFSYFLLHLFIRVFLTNSLEVDEAEQVFLSQQWQLGYNQQPPLYTWIIKILLHLFGYYVWVIIMLRFLLLTGIVYGVYKITKMIIQNHNVAVISSISLFLFFQLSIESLRQTHTVLVTFSVVVLTISFFRLLKQQNTKNYVLFGVSLALGMLSKYNFVIPATALVICALTMRDYRKIVFTPKIIISILVFVILCFPHTIWLFQNFDNTSNDTIKDLATVQEQSYWLTTINSLWALLKGILSFGGIFMLLIIILFKGRILFLFKKGEDAQLVFLGRFLLFSLVILGVVLIVTKATNAHERWIQPLLFLAPVYIFARYKEVGNQSFNLLQFEKMLVFLPVLVLIYVVVSITFGPKLGFKERINKPYYDFSKYIIQENIIQQDEVIVCHSSDFGGNMKFQLPGHSVKIVTSNCVSFFVKDQSINMSKAFLIGTKEDIEFLIQCFEASNNLTSFSIRQKTFLYRYSQKDHFTFFYVRVNLQE